MSNITVVSTNKQPTIHRVIHSAVTEVKARLENGDDDIRLEMVDVFRYELSVGSDGKYVRILQNQLQSDYCDRFCQELIRQRLPFPFARLKEAGVYGLNIWQKVN